MAWKNPYPLIEVVWVDSTSHPDTWVAIEDIPDPARVNTTGFLVKETAVYIVVASSVSDEEDAIQTVGNTMTIPIGMIVSRTAIKIARARKRKKP